MSDPVLRVFTVTHTKTGFGFRKETPAVYPAVQFPNNRVAVDEGDGTITVYMHYDLMVKELEKTGEVRVEEQHAT